MGELLELLTFLLLELPARALAFFVDAPLYGAGLLVIVVLLLVLLIRRRRQDR